jgi:hypothetical protein
MLFDDIVCHFLNGRCKKIVDFSAILKRRNMNAIKNEKQSEKIFIALCFADL